MKQNHFASLAGVAFLVCGAVCHTNAASQITFDNFNNSKGHFGLAPNFSGQSYGMAAASVTDVVNTNGPIEGIGHLRLSFIFNETSTAFQCRFLSGGGTAGNNVAFYTTNSVNGFIGYYLKTTNANWVTCITLDGEAPFGVAQMDSGVLRDVIADGEWHLYEWDLDSTTDWGAVPSIGGGHGGALNKTNHTIDSIFFRYNGTLDATANSLLYLDYVALNPAGSVSNMLNQLCLQTPGVVVAGPIATNAPQVRVVGVQTNATLVTVYQNSGPNGAMIPIGSSNNPPAGEVFVKVTGLAKGATIKATEVLGGIESCMPDSGLVAGGGANPSLRAALSIRETTGTGPIGDPNPDSPQNGNIHFLGTTALSGGAPLNAPVIYPSNEWQTVTFLRGTNVTIGDVANLVGTTVPGTGGYDGNNSVAVQVYAYKNVPSNGSRIFSTTVGQGLDVNSAQPFYAKWTWDAVSGADGYRVLRSWNYSDYNDYQDVPTNGIVDMNSGWVPGPVAVEPKSVPYGPSVKWNAASGDPAGSSNNIPGDWGILEALAFTVNGDTGPFDLYIDSVQNGETVFQSFDSATNGAPDVGFRAPRFSGSTDTMLLDTPNIGLVSDAVAFDGPNSLHLSWQWNGLEASKWLRLTTSGLGNPMVDLNQPISFKILMLPVGSSLPQQNPGSMTIARYGNDVVLNWTGSYYLQSSASVDTGYADIGTTPMIGPYTNSVGAAPKFYRLRK